MVKGERIMPVPEGVITTSELWEQPNGSNNQAPQAQAQEGIAETINAPEQEVVEGGSQEQE
jgi:hypothetical protein